MVMAALLVLADADAAWGESPPDAPRVRYFDVLEIAVDGNSVVDEADIQETLAPFLGPGKTAQDVDRAREALQQLYRELGFQTVAVSVAVESRKTIAEGLIILKVDEGRIHKLSISGANYFSIERIREKVPSLQEGQVPDFEAVQSDIMALGRLPDRQITPAIKRDETTGDLDVDLVVTDTLPLHGLLELNNRYSNGTSHERALAMLSWDNMLQRGDSLSLMMQTSPQQIDEGLVFFASWLTRFDDPYFTLQFSVLDTQSDVASLGGTNIVGKGSSFGAKGIWQRPVPGGWLHNMAAGIERKDFLNQVKLGGVSLDSPLIYYPLTISWSVSHQGDNGTGRYGVDLMATLPGLGSETGTIDLSRYGARRQMHWLRGSTAITRELPDGFLSPGFEVAFNGSMQLTDIPLVSNEQISAGGMDSVRGYFESESTGDLGVLAALELRTPPVTQFFQGKAWVRHVNEGRMYFFIDAGRVSLKGPLPDTSQRDSAELYATGVGVKFGFFEHLNAVFEWANPLADGPYTMKNDGRLLFRISGTF